MPSRVCLEERFQIKTFVDAGRCGLQVKGRHLRQCDRIRGPRFVALPTGDLRIGKHADDFTVDLLLPGRVGPCFQTAILEDSEFAVPGPVAVSLENKILIFRDIFREVARSRGQENVISESQVFDLFALETDRRVLIDDEVVVEIVVAHPGRGIVIVTDPD